MEQHNVSFFAETYLSIHQHHVAISKLPSDGNEADLGKQPAGNGFAIIVAHLT